jgi:Na+-translocating ferredoxin:NAD+ oxidoreductase RnfG subunit
MKFKKEYLKPTLVLGVICLVAALLVGGLNEITKSDSTGGVDSVYLESMMSGTHTPADVPERTPTSITVTEFYTVHDSEGNLIGHIVILEKQGYASTIKMAVSVSTNKTVQKVDIIEQKETHGKNISGLISSLVGKDSGGVDSAEVVTGATVTSGRIKNAVYDVFVALGYAEPKVADPRIENITAWSYVGIAIAVLTIGGAVAYTIVKRRKGI